MNHSNWKESGNEIVAYHVILNQIIVEVMIPATKKILLKFWNNWIFLIFFRKLINIFILLIIFPGKLLKWADLKPTKNHVQLKNITPWTKVTYAPDLNGKII